MYNKHGDNAGIPTQVKAGADDFGAVPLAGIQSAQATHPKRRLGGALGTKAGQAICNPVAVGLVFLAAVSGWEGGRLQINGVRKEVDSVGKLVGRMLAASPNNTILPLSGTELQKLESRARRALIDGELVFRYPPQRMAAFVKELQKELDAEGSTIDDLVALWRAPYSKNDDEKRRLIAVVRSAWSNIAGDEPLSLELRDTIPVDPSRATGSNSVPPGPGVLPATPQVNLNVIQTERIRKECLTMGRDMDYVTFLKIIPLVHKIAGNLDAQGGTGWVSGWLSGPGSAYMEPDPALEPPKADQSRR